MSPPPLTFLTLRLKFRAETAMALPRWKGALLRGGLGHALKRALCDPACGSVAGCAIADCPYRTIFAPEAEEGRSDLPGVRDVPRPYAVLPPLEAQVSYRPGDVLPFGLLLAGRAIEYLPHIIHAFEALGEMGLGQQRGRASLQEIESYNPLTDETLPLLDRGILRNQILAVSGAEIFEAVTPQPAVMRLRFMTPMRIKHEGRMVEVPECHVLVRAALRRLSQLSAFYGTARWEIPFGEIIDLAHSVRLRESRVQWVDWSRTSGTSGQHMTLGGFVGSAIYDDVPAGIRSLLLAGSVAHIGKAVVFGHGSYMLTPGAGSGSLQEGVAGGDKQTTR